MSVSTAIAVSASMQAAAAAAQAHAARLAACNALMATYESKTASVGQIRQYAGCAQDLYPEPEMPVEQVYALKIAIALLLISPLLGLLWAYRRGDGSPFDYVMGAIGGAIFMACGLFVTIAAAAGIHFIFTG